MKFNIGLLFSCILLLHVGHTSGMENNSQSNASSTPWPWSWFQWKNPLSPQECANCKNNLGARHIKHANLMQGSDGNGQGGNGSPVTIEHLHGNNASSHSSGNSYGGSSTMSPEALIALEKEKTKQLELANAQALLIEHERNKWFNTLAQYFDERLKQENDVHNVGFFLNLKEMFEQNYAHLQQLEQDQHAHAQTRLKEHHKVLRELEVERGKNELAKERIRQEKLPQILEHDLAKTKMLHEQALEKLNRVGQGIYAFTDDKERMTKVTAMIAGTALGIYGAKRGTKVAAEYASAILMKPALVTETSRLSMQDVFRHPIKTFRRTKEDLPQPIYNDELQKQVDIYVHSIKDGKKNGQPFRHGLFFGLPGTGKTLIAKTIARDLGMPYAIVAGANIHQFPDGQDVEALNKLFDWAQQSGTVLFFDECDALAPKRVGSTSEKARKIQNTFYAHTGTETRKFLLLGATNEPGLLDAAFLSRMDERIQFDLPDQQTRLKLLKLFYDQYIAHKDSNIKISGINQELNLWVVDQTKGFSGREISQLVRSFRAQASATENKTITPELIREVVRQKREQQEKLKNYSSTVLPA